MYRYRDQRGSTNVSLKRLAHLSKLGKFLYVRGYCYRDGQGIKQMAVLVRGSLGSARFGGFAWGYGGEGPRGLKTLLNQLGVDAITTKKIVEDTRWDGWEKVGESWRISLASPVEVAA